MDIEGIIKMGTRNTIKTNMNETNFNLNFGRFKTLSEGDKQKIMEERSAKNTNKATKQWVDLFHEINEFA